MDPQDAHAHSFKNWEEIVLSDECGCFYCKEIFRPQEITQWVTESDGEQTAVCPYCGVDSVIGNGSAYSVALDFLNPMHERRFDTLDFENGPPDR